MDTPPLHPPHTPTHTLYFLHTDTCTQRTISLGDIQQQRVTVYWSRAVITFTGDEHSSVLWTRASVYPVTADFTA